MLRWTLVFLLLALFNGIMGFTGLAYASSGMAIFAFFVFLVVSIVTFTMYWKARNPPGPGKRV